MGFGWQSTHASGKGADTITSGFEGAWTADPTKWDNGYFDLLFGYEWEKVETPAGKIVWHAIGQKEEDMEKIRNHCEHQDFLGRNWSQRTRIIQETH